jgi:succinate dehydrogenase / fumarate reductase iron-sulfur subunit
MLQVSVYRFNPETDSAPKMQDYNVDTSGKDLMVLDVLEMIKADYDASVTYRRSCREGVCGSDGLNMNGRNGLACITPLSEGCEEQQASDSATAWLAGRARSRSRYEFVLRSVREN